MSERNDHSTGDETSTTIQLRKLYEDRWSGYENQAGLKRFSDKLSAKDLQNFELFKSYDLDFLEKISHDLAVAKWERGAILFEEGTYLDLAFYIAAGDVDVYLDKHGAGAAQPIFNNTVISDGDAQSEGIDPVVQPARPIPSGRGATPPITFLNSMDFDLPRGESARLGPGELFGEIGSLNGWPQSVTARIASEATLVHIRLPALREMKKKSSEFKDRIDAVYRERTLRRQLATTPLFKHVDPTTIDRLAERVALVSCVPEERITREGDPVEALYMVRSGFVRLSQTIGDKEVTVSYLSKGMTLGEVELLIDGIDAARYTAQSVGYTELVKIDKQDFSAFLAQEPTVARQLWDATVLRIKDGGHTRKHLDKADLIEFALAKGLVQGNSMLVIDLDVCTRCDDCVEGCTNTHGGRPRFVREGEKYDNFLIARSCYHCEDPVCLIGCPTGAIRRTNVAEVVAIDDDLCIGCSNCANKCPYDAIVMHDTGETWPDNAIPSWLRGRDRKVASKCDLCYTSSAGPACVNSCPHSCAFRVGSLDDFRELLAIQSATK